MFKLNIHVFCTDMIGMQVKIAEEKRNEKKKRKKDKGTIHILHLIQILNTTT